MAVVSHKCPNCSGGLVFDPGSQKFHCEYCRSYFSLSELGSQAPQETPAPDAASQKESTQEAVLYSCPSCGAEVMTDSTTAAAFCYYCHNPVVLSGRLSGELLPDTIIPFAIDREKAVAGFLGWTSKKWFVPRAFFSKKQIELITGVYFPYWVIDADLHGRLDANATRVRTWRAGDTQYTETRFYRVAREGDISFRELTKNALVKADRQFASGVQPFDYSAGKSFSTAYLSGFQAEKRDIERDTLQPEVMRELERYAQTLLQERVSGYTAVTGAKTGVRLRGADWRYGLLPVWVLTYRARGGKMFYYAMNGQTGKTCGVLPVDAKRLAVLFAAVALPLFLLLTLLGGGIVW